MPRGRPVDEETRARVVELHGQGMGRNAIAREVGIGAASVTAIAEAAGLAFDWRSTELAVRARQVELGMMRAELAQAAMVRAFEALDAFSAPTVRVDFSPASDTRSAEYHEHVSDGPTISDQRNLATIFGILTQRATDLMRTADGGGVNGQAASMLDGLAAGLSTVAEKLRADDPSSDPTADPEKLTREDMIADLEQRIEAEGGEPDELAE